MQILFIGGANDGKIIELDNPPNIYRVPVLNYKETMLDPFDINLPIQTEEHWYLLESLKGQNETFYFYRWEKLTIDDAIMRLLSGYQSMNTSSKREHKYDTP